MSFRTPRTLATGHGSAGAGTHHWWVQRVTSVALIPLTVLAILPFAHAAGDPKGEANHAAKGELPAGAGLAAGFKGDVGIAKHDSVIFADNFEEVLFGVWQIPRFAMFDAILIGDQGPRLRGSARRRSRSG